MGVRQIGEFGGLPHDVFWGSVVLVGAFESGCSKQPVCGYHELINVRVGIGFEKKSRGAQTTRKNKSKDRTTGRATEAQQKSNMTKNEELIMLSFLLQAVKSRPCTSIPSRQDMERFAEWARHTKYGRHVGEGREEKEERKTL